jgi:hypothetical protein
MSHAKALRRQEKERQDNWIYRIEWPQKSSKGTEISGEWLIDEEVSGFKFQVQ